MGVYVANQDPRCATVSLTYPGTRVSLNEPLVFVDNNMLVTQLAPHASILAWIMVIVGFLHVIVSSIAYGYYRNRYKRLMVRPFSLAILTSITSIVLMVSTFLIRIVWMPCSFYIALQSLIVPLYGMGFFIRIVEFFNRSVFALAVNDLSIGDDESQSGEKKRPANVVQDIRAIFKKQASLASAFNASTRLMRTNTRNQSSSNRIVGGPSSNAIATLPTQKEETAEPSSSPTPSFKDLENANETAHQPKLKDIPHGSRPHAHSSSSITERELRILKTLKSQTTRIFLLVIVLFGVTVDIIFDLTHLPQLHPDAHCFGCVSNRDQLIKLVAGGCTIVILSSLIAWRARWFPDNYGLMRELRITVMYGGVPMIIGLLLGTFIRAPVALDFSFFNFMWVGVMVIQFFSLTWQVHLAIKSKEYTPEYEMYLKAEEKRKRRDQQKSHKSTTVRTGDEDEYASDAVASNLKQILDGDRDSEEFLAFEQFLTGEFATENLRMYVECSSWKKSYFDMNASTRRSRAKRIVTLFVQASSVFDVNLPAAVRQAIITQVVNNSTEELPRELFDASQHEMMHMLRGSYERYLSRIKPI